MIVENAFSVAARTGPVFDTLVDLERLVACLPGARLDGVINGGSAATGRVRLPLGQSSVHYRGTLRISGSDRSAGSVSLALDGREVRGSGRVTAAIDIRLREKDGITTASLRGTSDMTGRAAAVEPDLMRRSASKLLTRFGAGLRAAITAPERRAPRRRGPAAGGLDGAIRALEVLETPAAPPIRGVVTIVTDGPVEVPRVESAMDAARRWAADRRWILPATIVAAVILFAAMQRVRHRESAPWHRPGRHLAVRPQ